uniref:GDSL esterase/lipase At5g62930-like n=1 Tax=Styela clava TaxID=7725 RepID=UPI001939AD0D|nr:GDSL esterase/lipase At5g62930-like [Styela clava]
MAAWKKMILFGDSLTQYSFQPQGFGSAIANELQRKADVINRGFSGYNTDNAVAMLHGVFPTGSLKAEDAITVCFGANDSVLSGFHQHVPIQRYESNCRKIINHLTGLGLPSSRILIISPPVVDTEKWLAHLISENKGTEVDRDNENTKKYAEACSRVASDMSCPFVNLWESFMQEEEYNKLLNDGLHFSEEGNRLVTKLILPHILKMSEEWEMNYAEWQTFYDL